MDADTIEMGAVTGRLRALAQDMNLTILIVDDDELERALISDRLEARGFEVARAANGAQALALLEGPVIPVLLVDWSMPVISRGRLFVRTPVEIICYDIKEPGAK